MAANVNEEVRVSVVCPCCGEQCSAKWMRVPRRDEDCASFFSLLRCSSCSHTWLENQPTPTELKYYYGPDYHRAVGAAGEKSPKRRWGQQVEVITKFKSGGLVLDIGCSSGGFLAYLKSDRWRLYGIEADQPTAERARASTGAEVFAGDVADASFPDDTFDLVTCSDVLEHLYEPGGVFRKVYHWLKPGGIFYVFVPNIMSWEARVFRSYWYGLDLPRHLHHFSKKSLGTLAAYNGFRQLRMATPPGCYLEQSASAILHNEPSGASAQQVPEDQRVEPGLAWRLVRKGLRIATEVPYSLIASSCGTAPSLQVIFQKGN